MVRSYKAISGIARCAAQRNAFQSYSVKQRRATLATHAASSVGQRQTLIEKIVQRYAVDLRPSQAVKAGDYVSIRPNVVMTHDNTGPCISK
jgi:homoaconitate hydratase